MVSLEIMKISNALAAPPDSPIPYAMERISCRLANVLYARYYEHKTLEQIGKELGCTKERIRQLEAEGLRALRKELLAWYESSTKGC